MGRELLPLSSCNTNVIRDLKSASQIFENLPLQYGEGGFFLAIYLQWRSTSWSPPGRLQHEDYTREGGSTRTTINSTKINAEVVLSKDEVEVEPPGLPAAGPPCRTTYRCPDEINFVLNKSEYSGILDVREYTYVDLHGKTTTNANGNKNEEVDVPLLSPTEILSTTHLFWLGYEMNGLHPRPSVAQETAASSDQHLFATSSSCGPGVELEVGAPKKTPREEVDGDAREMRNFEFLLARKRIEVDEIRDQIFSQPLPLENRSTDSGTTTSRAGSRVDYRKEKSPLPISKTKFVMLYLRSQIDLSC